MIKEAIAWAEKPHASCRNKNVDLRIQSSGELLALGSECMTIEDAA